MFLMLAVTASAVDSTRESQNQAYRDYLETYRGSNAAYRRDKYILTLVDVAILAGLIIFVLVPARRALRTSLEKSKQQQKILEEIRDLLKKNNDT
jgi:large-conductance mechanosensitive channel